MITIPISVTEDQIDSKDQAILQEAKDYTDNTSGTGIIDKTPTEGSTNLVESGGVKTYIDNAIEGKQDILTAGNNITIIDNVISSSAGGSYIFDILPTEDSQNPVTSDGIFNAIKALDEKYASKDGKIELPTMTLSQIQAGMLDGSIKEGDIVYLNDTINNILYIGEGLTFYAYAKVFDPGVTPYISTTELFGMIAQVNTTLITHLTSDVNRWQHDSDENYKSYIRDAALKGLIPDNDNAVTTEGPIANVGVTNPEGGLLSVTMKNTEAISGRLTILHTDGTQESYSSSGIRVGSSFTVHYGVRHGDVYTTSNAIVSQTYVPFMVDPNYEAPATEDYVDNAISNVTYVTNNLGTRISTLESDSQNYVTNAELALYDTSVQVDNKIAAALVDELDEDDVTRIVNAAIIKAETDGTIATEDWVEEQGYTTLTYVNQQDAILSGELSGKQNILIPGDNITIDNTDPDNPVISSVGDSIPQLVLETLLPLGTSASMIFGFSGDTTEIITASCNKGITFLAPSYSSENDITNYTAAITADQLNDDVRITPIFTIQKDAVEVVIWAKNYSPIDFGIFSIGEIDTTPMEGSSNLITSGGVYDAIQPSTGYAYKTINLTDVKIGDDLSGAIINFNPNNLPMFLNPNAGLSGFQWVIWSGTSGAGINISVAWNANSIQDGNLNYIYNVPSGDLTVPDWIQDTYTFPDNTIVTEMRDLGGNRQNWDDVVVGCDPSGWNPRMATVDIRVPSVNVGDETKVLNLVGTDLYINGQEIDNVPIENSESLVRSGGVWSDTHYKVETESLQKTLYDIKVGDDISGVEMVFPNLAIATGGLPTINFTNGQHIGFRSSDNASWALWDTGDLLISEWAVTGHVTTTIYTFGNGYVVSSIENMNDTANIPKLITYTPNTQIEIIDIENLYNNKVDKYYDLIQVTKTFEDLVVGDDLSGVTVTFPDPIDMTNITGSSTNSQIINFTNGYYINLSINTVQTPAYFRLIDTNGQAAQNFYENSKTPTVTSYTFPNGFVISNINTSDINQFYGGSWQTQITFNGIQIESEITIKWLYDQIIQEIANLKSHVLHDADLYQSILVAAREEAQAIYDGTDVPLSSTGVTVIGTGGLLDIGSTGQYVAPSNGGITITFSAVLALGNVAVLVNGTEVFNSSVLSLLSVPPPTTVRVNSGDIITSTGSLGLLSSLNVTFYPNKPI